MYCLAKDVGCPSDPVRVKDALIMNGDEGLLAGLVMPREIDSGYAFSDVVASVLWDRLARHVDMGMMLVLVCCRVGLRWVPVCLALRRGA